MCLFIWFVCSFIRSVDSTYETGFMWYLSFSVRTGPDHNIGVTVH